MLEKIAINNKGKEEKVRIAVLASGNGTNLQAVIDAQKKSYFSGEVTLVISDKKDAFALERAARENIDTFFLDPRLYESKDTFDDALIDILKKKKINLLALAGYMRILSPRVVKAFYPAIINIHPSLLPSFPGKQGVKDALKYGVKVTGVTVHLVDEGMDTGPIILQEAVRVEDSDDEKSLHGRIQKVEHRLYPEAVKFFCQGRLTLKGRRCFIED